MRQSYGRLEKCVLSARKTMSATFLLLGGGVLGGGGRLYFYGREDFSENSQIIKNVCVIILGPIIVTDNLNLTNMSLHWQISPVARCV